jgi:GTP pyrophosphokinase
MIETSWDTDQATAFKVEVEVEALDRPKLLRDVTTVLADSDVNILSASVQTSREHVAVLKFVFEIGNVSHLQTILNNVKRVPAVYDAYRVEPGKSNKDKTANRWQIETAK